MKYFVISKDELPIAVVFHESTKGKYIVRSLSEAFEASANFNSNFILAKDSNKLKFKEFGPHHPGWSDKVLQKICTGFWAVEKTGNLSGDVFVEDIVQQFLISDSKL